jgi:hypothetical protein
MMKGTIILAAFFAMFAFASILIPSPMFPGSILCATLGEVASRFSGLLSALANGVFYGAILWTFFATLSRGFEEK